MHCTDATCVNLCPAGARFRTDSGAVGTDNEKCVGCQSCVVACPFGKPRYSEETNKAYKCKLCTERVQNNLPPACVKACPTGALRYGDKGEMLALAYKRVKELGGDASVYGDKFFGGTHVIYVLEEKIDLYNALPAKPKVASSTIFWKEMVKFGRSGHIGSGLALLAIASLLKRRGDCKKPFQPGAEPNTPVVTGSAVTLPEMPGEISRLAAGRVLPAARRIAPCGMRASSDFFSE